MEDDSQRKEFPARVSTGITGLNDIIDGGFVSGSTYLIHGGPGTGKTILANQVAFDFAARRKNTLYVTFLCESHDRMLQHLSQMTFYDGTQINRTIHYFSALAEVEQTGLDGVLSLLHKERKRCDASLIVIEGLFILAESAPAEQDFRKFVSRLTTFANLTDTNILTLTNSSRKSSSPEFTMVDGWIELRMEQLTYRTHRSIEVHKFRASNITLGRHMFLISNAGLRVLPRFETLPRDTTPSAVTGQDRISTGVPDLDPMLQGGFPAGSTTLLAGPTGAGKTTLGIHFMSQCTSEAPGLLISFYETANRLFIRAKAFGVDLESLVDQGDLEIIWLSPAENLLDDISYRIVEAVRARGARRLFIDGVDAVSQSVIYPQRVRLVLGMLAARLRRAGVTSMFTSETSYLMAGENNLMFGAISAVADNILLLRYLELDSTLSRVLSLVKVRDSAFNAGIHEYAITSNGIRLGKPLKDSDKAQTGGAHQPQPGEHL